MALSNLANVHYTATEKTAVQTALTALEAALTPKFRSLSAEERKRFGSINEQNKLIVLKALDYRNSDPTLSSTDVDWAEFQNDYDSRLFLQSTEARLQKIAEGLNINKILHDFDNYQDALIDYGYSQYKAGTKATGFDKKVAEMAQFFNRTGTSAAVPGTDTPQP